MSDDTQKALDALDKHEKLVDQKGYDGTAFALLLMPHLETIRKALTLITAIRKEADDFVVVPRNPTGEMLSVGLETINKYFKPSNKIDRTKGIIGVTYVAMIQAAQEDKG